MNATRVPSDDHTGLTSSAGSSVSRVALPARCQSITQMSAPDPSCRVTAISLPSGETSKSPCCAASPAPDMSWPPLVIQPSCMLGAVCPLPIGPTPPASPWKYTMRSFWETSKLPRPLDGSYPTPPAICTASPVNVSFFGSNGCANTVASRWKMREPGAA